MLKKSGLMLTCAGAIVFVGVLVAAGCGGGGPNTPVAALSTAAQFNALLPAAQKSATRVGAAKCTPCHAADCTTQAATRHAAVSVDCESCHGPGSVHVANHSLTNILRGPDVVRTAVCGQCHSDVVADFNQSMHAQMVTSEVNSGSATCLRCHSGAFHTLNISSPLSHGQTPAQVDAAIVALPSATLLSYAAYNAVSPVVPGSSHDSIACAGCHDPHQNTNNLVHPASNPAGQEVYLRLLSSNTDMSSDPAAATPAQYTTINQICGQCHNNRGGDPSDAGLAANTSRAAVHEGPEYNMINGNGGAEGITTTNGTTYATGTAAPAVRTSSHVTAPDQCVTCHMPNARHTFTVSLDVSCSPCHTSADAAARESSVQTSVQNALAALAARMANWSVTIGASPGTGLPVFKDPTGQSWNYSGSIPSTDVMPTNWQKAIPIQIKRARHNYSLILLDRSYGVHNYVYTQYLLNQSNVGLDALGISRSVAVPQNRRDVMAILNASLAQLKAAHGNTGD